MASARFSFCPVCMGTVLFSITSLELRASAAIRRAELSMELRSASPSSMGGVPTQIKMASPKRTASPRSAVNASRLGRPVARHDFVQVQLIDGQLAAIEGLNLARHRCPCTPRRGPFRPDTPP